MSDVQDDMTKISKTSPDMESVEKAICGIIMPISGMPPKYDAGHWSDVRKVIDAAIELAGMTSQIVSDSFETDVIQQRIIHNLYNNPVVVCDVSGLNPNVMFELGIRITFKLPVIIITDDFSAIPFDTKIIEHLKYPQDLHIHQTNEFIKNLADRISRLNQQKNDGTFKSFIESFGTYDVLEPTTKTVEIDQLILDKLEDIERNVSAIKRESRQIHPSSNRGATPFRPSKGNVNIRLSEPDGFASKIIIDNARKIFANSDMNIEMSAGGDLVLQISESAINEQHGMTSVLNSLMRSVKNADKITISIERYSE